MKAAPSEGIQPWSDGVAIVGMAARFPRAANLDEFWQRLLGGESLLTNFSQEELRKAGVPEDLLAYPDYVPTGAVIDEADAFDAGFFGFSKREAEMIDPQQRVFLETSWEALEHAGYTGKSERVGVFAGVSPTNHTMQLLSDPAVVASAGVYQIMIANDKDYLATRVAYKLDLRGPAVSIQAACSTSLAAVHLACQSVLSNECDLALAGGVSLRLPQTVGYLYMPSMILSKDGSCRPFDAASGGTVPGSGCGVVVLKRLSRAIADDDTIYSVIRGSAWNNDGAGKLGFTVPSVEGQVRVVRDALRAAGVPASQIGYVEAHGTGTEMGDPIEFAALSEAFAADGVAPGSCTLGALKSNMGHADVAAGVAGLIKASLAVHHGVIPATLHFREPNPELPYTTSPFRVSDSAVPWTASTERWAGVSAFGIGGTNVHVVLSNAPQQASRSSQAVAAQVFPISARSSAALANACTRLSDQLVAGGLAEIEDIASTLQLGRRSFLHRRAEVASTKQELVEALSKPRTSRNPEPLELSRDVVFLFPGQGQQFAGMARTLYQRFPEFRRSIDLGAALLRDEYGLNAAEVITGAEGAAARIDSLADTRVAQPILFLTEVALAAQWRALGMEPVALLGHSLGELTAACVAGLFSFEDGVRLAAERGRLMAQTPPGLMLAISLSPERLAGYLDRDVWLAAENSPRMSVASGLSEAVERLERRLAIDRVSSVRLSSKNAFHTPLMAEAAAQFAAKVESVPRQLPAIPWISNVTGEWVDTRLAQSGSYWADQMTSAVLFTQGLAALADRPRLFLEMGPGEALTGIARQQLRSSVSVPCLGPETRAVSDEVVFLQAVARAWECGGDVNWRALHPEASRRRVALPTYPFERQRCWIEPSADRRVSGEPAKAQSASFGGNRDGHQGKRSDVSSWFSAPFWSATAPASISANPAKVPVASWLVLTDGSALARAVITAFEIANTPVIVVGAGSSFEEQGRDFVIDPACGSDYDELLRRVLADATPPQGVLSFWTLGEPQAPVYDSFVLLLQASGRQRHRFTQIEVVTEKLQSVSGEPTVHVERAELLGLLPVIAAEYNGTQCRSIDVQVEGNAPDAVVGLLLEEIATEAKAGVPVAYRNGRRWMKDWTAIKLEASHASPFRVGGRYLITGGLGGIGYSLALSLLERFGARVVLTGRSALPPRTDWDRYVEGSALDPRIGQRIERLQALEKAGGTVRFVAADVADPQAMRRVVSQAREEFGGIDGVIHAAGLPAGSMLGAQDLKEAERIREPKVKGSIVLAQALQGEKLDFLLFCSSVTALVPSLGQAAYAAANTFQNEYAEFCRETLSLPATAIAFDAWQEVGMAAEMELPAGFEALALQRRQTAMTPAEGIEVIARVAARWHGAQIAATTLPLNDLRAQNVPSAPAPEEVRQSANEEDDAECTTVMELWKELLGNDDIRPTDNFFELGGHSMLGTMLIARLRDRFGVVLSLRTIFDSPTPSALAQILRASSPREDGPALTSAGHAGLREEFEI